MADNNALKIEKYEYYISILDIMLSDMSDVTLSDIQDVIDELYQELERIEKEGEKMRCQPIKPQGTISFLASPSPNPRPEPTKKQLTIKITTEDKDTFVKSKLPQEGGQE